MFDAQAGLGREKRRTKRLHGADPAPASATAPGSCFKGQGRGRAGAAPPAGDLYVVTRVEPSKLYERRGDDLVLEVPVTFDEAALGATVEIPTPDGRVSLKVPPGHARTPRKPLRVAGRGAPEAEGFRPRRDLPRALAGSGAVRREYEGAA